MILVVFNLTSATSQIDVPLHCPALHPPPPPLADIYIPIDLGRWGV
jgi:hypothetical protein